MAVNSWIWVLLFSDFSIERKILVFFYCSANNYDIKYFSYYSFTSIIILYSSCVILDFLLSILKNPVWFSFSWIFLCYRFVEAKTLQNFGKHETQFDSSRCFCWGCEGYKPHWTMRYEIWLIFSQCLALDLPIWLKNCIKIHCFRLIWSCLIVELLATWAKFFELSGYCTVINCAFNFCRTQFKFVWHNFPN